MNTARPRKEKPAYSSVQNIAFIISLAWRERRSVIVFVPAMAAAAILLSLTQLFVVPSILEAVGADVSIAELSAIILFFTCALILLNASSSYLAACAQFGRIEIRLGIGAMIQNKALTMSYPIRPEGRYLLLDGLQDPGNLGTIIRGAEAFDVTALVLGQGCPDRFSPKVLRSTMGGVFRLPVFRSGDLPGTIRQMREAGLTVWAAMLDPGARPIRQLPGEGGLGVVIGNEGSGVSRAAASACDGAVYFPIAPRTESLNAAVAATVIMWEMSGRERGAGDGS